MTNIKRIASVPYSETLMRAKTITFAAYKAAEKAEAIYGQEIRKFELATLKNLRNDVKRHLSKMPNGTIYPVYGLVSVNASAASVDISGYGVKGMTGVFHNVSDAKRSWKKKNAPKSKPTTPTKCAAFKNELAALMKKHNVLNEWGVK